MRLHDNLLDDPTRSIGTRHAQIMGALTAGHRFMSGNDEWVERRVETIDDRYDLLNALLGYMVRFGHEQRPLSELMLLAKFSDSGDWNDNEKPNMDKLTRRYGISLLGPHKIAIAPTAPAMREILRGTQWGRVDLREYLLGLGGFIEKQENGRPRRLYCAGKQLPCVFLGKDVLDAVAFAPPRPGEFALLSKNNNEFDERGDAVSFM